VSIWERAGVHVYLVPTVPPANGSGQASLRSFYAGQELAYYRSLAQQDPVHITVLDAGTFVRTGSDQYPWRMPCVPREPGCGQDQTVAVRWVDGLHYCTSRTFTTNWCHGIKYEAGERRVASAVAAGLIPWLRPRPARG
jgi:hypothetical protein